MTKVYNRESSPRDNEEITTKEVLTIIKRSRATFDKLKSDGLIAPVCLDGNRYLYRRGDANALRQRIKIYL